ncbi:MAG: hypothetical protein GKR89_09355 [Candidatus Latescibacteria bacterium]|nr:hypothetical protein [Candidatus Latescibacterota bacterium]
MDSLLRALFSLGLFFFLLLCGCQLDYYAHLAGGQARIIWHCRSLTKVRQDTTQLPGDHRAFAVIDAVRQFGQRQIGLQPSDNYTCFFDTGDGPVSWNISASPPHQFAAYRWSFPIVGSLPYKGFFNEERARQEGQALQAQGYDVLVRPVSAYSTLGYFTDPVLSTMLNYTDEGLADLVLHELTHATVFAPEHTDYNESLANFVGRQGSLDFLAHYHGPDSPLIEQARQKRRDAGRFGAFMTELVGQLDSLYNCPLDSSQIVAQRRHLFATAKERFKELRGKFERSSYDGFLQWEINNARLLSYRRYNRSTDVFAQVFEAHQGHWPPALAQFQSCARQASPWDCLKQTAATLRQQSEPAATRGVKHH